MMSVLVNGNPSREFGMQRRFRQGEPLTLFLFTIMAEGLSGLMREAVAKKLYSSC